MAEVVHIFCDNCQVEIMERYLLPRHIISDINRDIIHNFGIKTFRHWCADCDQKFNDILFKALKEWKIDD